MDEITHIATKVSKLIVVFCLPCVAIKNDAGDDHEHIDELCKKVSQKDCGYLPHRQKKRVLEC